MIAAMIIKGIMKKIYASVNLTTDDTPQGVGSLGTIVLTLQ
jgi:hypothetical protein